MEDYLIVGKTEFLEILKRTLEGELSADKIKQNIDFYDNYIGSSSNNEENIINELGDPRLIAKTIIESERIAKGKGKYNRGGSYQKQTYEEQENDNDDDKRDYGRTQFFGNIKWYHKAILIFIVFFVLIIFLFLGRILISILLAFGFPIILIIIFLSQLRKR
jgi:hypothetical protein